MMPGGAPNDAWRLIGPMNLIERQLTRIADALERLVPLAEAEPGGTEYERGRESMRRELAAMRPGDRASYLSRARHPSAGTEEDK